MTLGTKIKKLRNANGYTQKELADRVHVTFQTVSKWENDENEPDVGTLRILAKFFDCSLDYLLSEDDDTPAVKIAEDQEQKTEDHFEDNTNKVEQASTPVVTPQPTTTIIYQKELHICEYCKKEIPENELVMEDVRVSSGAKGHHKVYRQAYYHKNCLAKLHLEREKAAIALKKEKGRSSKKKCFGWSIFAGIVAFTISLLIMLLNESVKAQVHPALAVLYSLLIGYAIFAMIYCILSGSYIGDVFVWCATRSVKFPAIIFSWDLDGFAFLIAMKVFFAIIGFLVGIFTFLFAVAFSASLGFISFPFVLIHNNNTDYEDSMFGD